MQKDTNPKDALGTAKWRNYVTVPFQVLWELGVAMLEGSLKYGRHNYRASGVRASVYVDAALGHIHQYWEGEDNDPDSTANLSHITKAIASLTVLRDAQMNNFLVDDRPPMIKDMDGLRERLQGAADRLWAEHAEKNPHHYSQLEDGAPYHEMGCGKPYEGSGHDGIGDMAAEAGLSRSEFKRRNPWVVGGDLQVLFDRIKTWDPVMDPRTQHLHSGIDEISSFPEHAETQTVGGITVGIDYAEGGLVSGDDDVFPLMGEPGPEFDMDGIESPEWERQLFDALAEAGYTVEIERVGDISVMNAKPKVVDPDQPLLDQIRKAIADEENDLVTPPDMIVGGRYVVAELHNGNKVDGTTEWTVVRIEGGETFAIQDNYHAGHKGTRLANSTKFRRIGHPRVQPGSLLREATQAPVGVAPKEAVYSVYAEALEDNAYLPGKLEVLSDDDPSEILRVPVDAVNYNQTHVVEGLTQEQIDNLVMREAEDIVAPIYVGDSSMFDAVMRRVLLRIKAQPLRVVILDFAGGGSSRRSTRLTNSQWFIACPHCRCTEQFGVSPYIPQSFA